MTSKDTNPKDAVGTRKVPWSVLPLQALGGAALALLEGARKYGRHNYRPAGVRASIYIDAVMARHIPAWWEGQDIDPDSGLNHIDKAIASLLVLRDSMLQGNWIDDRPPAVTNQDWIADLNAKAGEIIDRIPDAKPPHTHRQASPVSRPVELPDRVERLALRSWRVNGKPGYAMWRGVGLDRLHELDLIEAVEASEAEAQPELYVSPDAAPASSD